MQIVNKIIRKDHLNPWSEMWIKKDIKEELYNCRLEYTFQTLFENLINKKAKILDAGCGIGKWVIYYCKKDYDIIGVDNNDIALEIVRNYDQNLRVEWGDILQLKFPNNFFDSYISMGVIEHFQDGPLMALKEAHRVLKPNGLIFISVPTVNILRKIIRPPLRNFINLIWGTFNPFKILVKLNEFLRENKNMYNVFYEYRFTISEIKNFLKKSNFEPIYIGPHDYDNSTQHSIGLVLDFNFLGGGKNFRLNKIGQMLLNILNFISPWISCSSVLCIAKTVKK